MPGIKLLAALPPVADVPASTSWHSLPRKRRVAEDDGTQRADERLAPDMSTRPYGEPIALERIDFMHPTALVFGNERLGISDELLNLCDGAFHIPLYGLTESLNVSVAAAIAMHYGRLSRMRSLRSHGIHGPEQEGDLSAEEIGDLLNKGLRK